MKAKLKELEMQLNWVCYEKEMITKLSKVWEAYFELKEEFKNLNLDFVTQQRELLLLFQADYNKRNFDDCQIAKQDIELFLKSNGG